MANAFAVQDSEPDPFSQVWADLESVLAELKDYGAPPDQALEVARDVTQNAFNSMNAGGASDAGFADGAENQNVKYDVNQDVAPVMAMKPMGKKAAAALTFGNSVTAGTLPYMAAGIKKLTGHDGGQDFETLRREEQTRAQAARDTLGEEATLATELAAPSAGVGMLTRGAKTMGQAAKRGAVAGGIYGTVRGYADPIDPDSADFGERLAPALMGGAMGAVTGAGGSAVAKGAVDRFTAPRQPAPKSKPTPAPRAPKPDPDAELMAIERGRDAAENTVAATRDRRARDEIPIRKFDDLPQNMQRQLMANEKPYFDRTYGENSKEWKAHVRQTVKDYEFGRTFRNEHLNNEGQPPEFGNAKDKIAHIAGLYQSGMSLNDIGRQIGETGEQVAQTILRGQQTLGTGNWTITSTVEAPKGMGIAAGLVHANQRTQQVPKAQVRGMLRDAESLLGDVNAYRASEVRSRANQVKPSPDPEPSALPPAAERPALTPPQAEPAAQPPAAAPEAPEAPPAASTKPRSLRGSAAAKKPKAPAKTETADAKPKAKPKATRAKSGAYAERGLSGTRPAKSPRTDPGSEDALYAREVADLTPQQRQMAAEEWQSLQYERMKAQTPAAKLGNREIALGWRQLQTQRDRLKGYSRAKLQRNEKDDE